MSDVPGGERNMTGILIAGLSVVSSGMQQIFCRTMQQKHGLASHELLANTAPAQARPPPSCGASAHDTRAQLPASVRSPASKHSALALSLSGLAALM